MDGADGQDSRLLHGSSGGTGMVFSTADEKVNGGIKNCRQTLCSFKIAESRF